MPSNGTLQQYSKHKICTTRNTVVNKLHKINSLLIGTLTERYPIQILHVQDGGSIAKCCQ